MRKLLCVSCLEHKTNDWVRSKINFLAGSQELILTTAKRKKLSYVGHVACHDNLSITILQGTLEGGRRRGRQKKSMLDEQHQRVDIPIDARPAQRGLLQKRLEEDLC